MTGRPRAEQLVPNQERMAADFAEFSTLKDDTVGGWTRTVFSDSYRSSRGWIESRMRDAGLETSIDAAGNIVGRYAGRSGASSQLMTGSHTDTVHAGGRFDGVVGVFAGIEIARRLRETDTRLDHDFVVVDFLGEEANDFGLSCMGSRSIAGILTAEHLDRRDDRGQRLGDAMSLFGLDTDHALRNAWSADEVHGYVELHIEQGPLLEASDRTIGVVTAIAGIERLMARFQGRADHAGTMPMDMRHDALAAAAAAVLAVERIGCGAPVHGVSTVGRIASSPGALNVVPDEAQVWAELRSTDREWLNGAKRSLVDDIAAEASRRGVDLLVEWLNDQDPVPAHPNVQDQIALSSDDLGIAWKAVPSGAGHDAAHLARLAPMGMIFVPSQDGRSHCPEEFTTMDDIAAGTHVLAATLIRMDEESKAP
jgi:N-carbamoyl-L-amino-acid hydrolase